MIELPENFDSIFRYIVVVSQRAEQLINGAKVRSETRHAKPTLAAKDDVDEGLVGWRVLTQEELDAQRQTVVDQFRAEVGNDGAEAEESFIRDVLPTAAGQAPEGAEPAEGEERDDELARLQRLLGMVKTGAAEESDEQAAEDAGGDDSGDDAGDEKVEEVSLEAEVDLEGKDDDEDEDE